MNIDGNKRMIEDGLVFGFNKRGSRGLIVDVFAFLLEIHH